MCRGLDKLIGATFLGSASKHPSASFRIASFKLERQLEYRATAVDIEDYAYLILGELEAAQLSQPPVSQAKVARLDGHGGGHDNAEKDKGKGKGKGKSERPCWGWQDGTGCRFGSSCLFLHAPLGPGRCWECGSESHLKPQCPLLGQGGKASNGGGGKGSAQGGSGGVSAGGSTQAGGSNSSSSTAATSGTTGASAEEKPARRPRKKGEKGGGKDRGPKEAVRKSEEEPAGEEAARASALTSGGGDNSVAKPLAALGLDGKA